MRTVVTCAVAAALVFVVPGCKSATAPASVAACATHTPRPSIWPANVTGCWIRPSVDTYTEFHLTQQGTVVSGAFAFCGPIGGCAPAYAVSGSVSFPSVELHWTEQNGQTYHITLDATISANYDTLAENGQPPGPGAYYFRVSAQ